MRASARVPLLAFSLAASLAAPALAQPPPGPGGPPPPGHSPAARRDTVLTLGGARQVWGHAGFGWLASPAPVRKRYTAGLDLGLGADRRFHDRAGLRARVDFNDLPSTQPGAVLVNGIAYDVSVDYGHGWVITALAGVTARPWRNLWLEASAGGGRFASGFAGEDFVDLATGTTLPIDARSGWGGAWSAGAHYEFQPSGRNRVLAELRYVELERGERRLGFFSLRAGYRLY